MSTSTAILAMQRPKARRLNWVNWVPAAAVVAVFAQLAVRAAVLASGNFYWDDLILIGRGSTFPCCRSELLLYDHDGHFMPGAFVLAALTTSIAPLEWFLPALGLLAMQAAASYAVFRLLRKILGNDPILLLPLMFYLFCPLTLPSFSWWAAALNALPLQFGLAWVAGDAIELARTGRRRYVFSGALVTTGSLLFFEKSLLVPAFAFVLVALMIGAKAAWKGAASLWVACGTILAGWAATFLFVTTGGLAFHGVRSTAELVNHGVSFGLLPTLLGGPWHWERWLPSGPWAAPPTALVWTAVSATVVAVLLSARRFGAIWTAVGSYVAFSCAVMVLSRSGPDTADELAQTLRYFADSAVVLAAAAALMLRSRKSDTLHAGWVIGTAIFVVSSLVSTQAYAQKWHDNPTAEYLANAREGLRNAEYPLLDQPISSWVLTPMAYPENTISRIFGAVPEASKISTSTPVLRYLDDTGAVVPAVVAPSRNVKQGPAPGCGHRVDGITRIPLDGALPNWDWTVQLNYFAPEDGEMELELDTGDAVVVPLRSGLNTAFVRLAGSGSALTATGNGVCVGAGPVGTVMLAGY